MREVCSIEALKAVAALAPKPVKKTPVRNNGHVYTGSQHRLIVPEYLDDNGIGFTEGRGAGYTKYILDECLFDPEHKQPDSMVTQGDDGALGFKCLHDSCSHNHWQEFKTAIGEPRPEHWNPPKYQNHSVKRPGQPRNGKPVDESGLNPYSNGAIVDNSLEKKKNEVFIPFPVESLPSVLRKFVTESSQAIGCDPTFSVLPALAVCASSVGTSRCLMVKRGWYVPSLIWSVIVGESGSQKSPPMRMAVQPLKDRQKRHIATHAGEMADYVDLVFDFKRTQKKWEKTGEGDRPEAPEEPVMPRCIVQDSTVEALAPILLGNRRGVLLARDELSGWFGSFNQYSKGGGTADVPKWLEIYNTESITIDRKTGDQKFIYVPHPSVNICGGIQPDILSNCLTDERKADGLQSRLLMAYPPRQPKRWRDDEVSEATLDSYHSLIEELSTLKPDVDISGDEKPTTLRLTADARQLYKDFINHHGDEQNALHGHLASQWSKLEETPVRLAIILHCIRQVTDGVDDAFRVDAATMQAAINIGEWFKSETLRINRLLTLPPEVREAQHLITWLQSRGGSITARDLYRLRRDIESIDEAEAKLIHLVTMGSGGWRDIHKSREFFLL